jgi:hypothetical protein
MYTTFERKHVHVDVIKCAQELGWI